MAITNPLGKKALIEKANSTVVVVTSVATFIVIFSLVASKFLIGQLAYQGRIISAKNAAVDQLKSDVKASNDLISSYQGFVNTSQNIIGGNSAGTGSQDGNNAKIVLDALPSQYDFPALASTLEKILTGQTTQSPPVSVKINNIQGTDNELTQGSATAGSVSAPAAAATTVAPTVPGSVPMPFQVDATGDYANVQNLVAVFERSIRPFQIQTMTLSGSQNQMDITLTAQTFYWPATKFQITTKVVQ